MTVLKMMLGRIHL